MRTPEPEPCSNDRRISGNLQPIGSRELLPRREILSYMAAFGGAFLATQGLISSGEAAEDPSPAQAKRAPSKRYDMKKSINFWALPYPSKMSLRECLELCKEAGFDGVELNYALEGDLTPETSDAAVRDVARLVRRIGLEVSGLCSFLFWPYSFTHEDPQRRQRGLELAVDMIRTARLLETKNLLVIAGSTYVPWLPDDPPVPFETCDQRAREALRKLIPVAEQAGISLNVENIFMNGYLHTPQELAAFVDSFNSPAVGVHFDTGNIAQYHFPEYWIPILGKRIRNVHLKEASKKVNEFNLHTFRPLLDGTTNWPAVLEALDNVGYRGYLTFEYFNPYPHWPEALVFHTSDALDRMLGRKV
ncbi:sugar phosphate isomerase/epimerase family protein [Thermogutta sp.]|uniref:sugar phosphate isomerase/epimerase family protein n=1 Tax=Thermogutta sp. TaxID=1962930 RepID=UPI003C7E0CE3